MIFEILERRAFLNVFSRKLLPSTAEALVQTSFRGEVGFGIWLKHHRKNFKSHEAQFVQRLKSISCKAKSIELFCLSIFVKTEMFSIFCCSGKCTTYGTFNVQSLKYRVSHNCISLLFTTLLSSSVSFSVTQFLVVSFGEMCQFQLSTCFLLEWWHRVHERFLESASSTFLLQYLFKVYLRIDWFVFWLFVKVKHKG